MKLQQIAAGAGTVLLASLAFTSLSLAAGAAAGAPAAAAPDDAEARFRKAAAAPTPRGATGKPDFSGYWVDAQRAGASHIAASAVNPAGYTTKPIAHAEIEDINGSTAAVARRQAATDMRPTYKPEHVAKARKNFEEVNFVDPGWGCQPLGVPRLGMPTEIVQTPATVYFLYQRHNLYRVIPVDGRAHDPEAERLPMGDSVGHFEGNTLVVDVKNLPDNDETWIDGDGSFHTGDLHVVERFTRQGNTLRYSVTMNDSIFTKPFSPRERSFVLGDAKAHAGEDYPCLEMSRPHMVNKDRH